MNTDIHGWGEAKTVAYRRALMRQWALDWLHWWRLSKKYKERGSSASYEMAAEFARVSLWAAIEHRDACRELI